MGCSVYYVNEWQWRRGDVVEGSGAEEQDDYKNKHHDSVDHAREYNASRDPRANLYNFVACSMMLVHGRLVFLFIGNLRTHMDHTIEACEDVNVMFDSKWIELGHTSDGKCTRQETQSPCHSRIRPTADIVSQCFENKFGAGAWSKSAQDYDDHDKKTDM